MYRLAFCLVAKTMHGSPIALSVSIWFIVPLDQGVIE